MFFSSTTPGVAYTYFIVADEVEWDYPPSNIYQITGKAFGEHEAFWVGWS